MRTKRTKSAVGKVPLRAGAWACAFRFVCAGTGQETAIFELGVVEVGR